MFFTIFRSSNSGGLLIINDDQGRKWLVFIEEHRWYLKYQYRNSWTQVTCTAIELMTLGLYLERINFYRYQYLLWQLHQEADRGCKPVRRNCEAAAVLLLGEPSLLTHSAQWTAVADCVRLLPWVETPHGPAPEHVAHWGLVAVSSYPQCAER